MTQKKILNFLQQNKPYFQQHFGVRSIGLFGSYAKNDFNETSDIDILVDLKEQKYDSWVSLKLYLEKAWNKHVDIITAGNHLRQQFLDTIHKEIIYV
ncbi:MAG TPA: nucleotidyltransferase domain-containing protein [Chitinophagaceae bacterium]|jgi:hypothetical protein